MSQLVTGLDVTRDCSSRGLRDMWRQGVGQPAFRTACASYNTQSFCSPRPLPSAREPSCPARRRPGAEKPAHHPQAVTAPRCPCPQPSVPWPPQRLWAPASLRRARRERGKGSPSSRQHPSAPAARGLFLQPLAHCACT